MHTKTKRLRSASNLRDQDNSTERLCASYINTAIHHQMGGRRSAVGPDISFHEGRHHLDATDGADHTSWLRLSISGTKLAVCIWSEIQFQPRLCGIQEGSWPRYLSPIVVRAGYMGSHAARAGAAPAAERTQRLRFGNGNFVPLCDALDPESGFGPSGKCPPALCRELPQHVVQDAAVLEVLELVERIDAAEQRYVLLRAVRVGDLG
jgi:hypothetical protein